jgi:hypothetical protein
MIEVKYVPTKHLGDLSHDMGDDSWKGRIPLVYDNHFTVFYGDPDTAHMDVIHAAGLTTDGGHGWIGYNPEWEIQSHGIPNGTHENYGWYDTAPEPEVDEAVAKHFNIQPDLAPDDMSAWKFGAIKRTHPHYGTGEPCNCSFTKHLHAHFHRTASKLDWLKSRPDMADKQRLLNLFETFPEKADPLLPWLAREVKKGRIQHSEDGRVGHLYHMVPIDAQGLPVEEGNHVGHQKRNLRPAEIAHWADWMNEKNHDSKFNEVVQPDGSVKRQKADIMQLKIHDLLERVAQWDEHLRNKEAQEGPLAKGHVVHQWPDGWTMRRLDTHEELQAEGDAMGHCVGGYGDEVAKGNAAIYSLRDPNHKPHVTIEHEPEGEDHFDIDHALDNHRSTRHFPKELKDEVREYHENGGSYPEGHPHFNDADHRANMSNILWQLQSDYTKKIPQHGIGGSIVQIYGTANTTPKPEYQERVKEWFNTWPEKPINNHYDDIYGIDHHEDLPDLRRRDVTPNEDEYGLPATQPGVYWDSLVESVVGGRPWGGHSVVDHDAIEKIHDYALKNPHYPGTPTSGFGAWNEYVKAVQAWHEDAMMKFDAYSQLDDDDFRAMENMTEDEQMSYRHEREREAWLDSPHGQALDTYWSQLKKHWNPEADKYLHPEQEKPMMSTFSASKPKVLFGQKNQVDSPFFGWFDRGNTRPIVFDPQRNHVMVGQYGTHHYDVMEEFGYTNPDLDPSMYSSDAIGEEHMPEVYYGTTTPLISDPKKVGMSHHGPWPRKHPEAIHALVEAGVIHQMPRMDDEDWKFGAYPNDVNWDGWGSQFGYTPPQGAQVHLPDGFDHEGFHSQPERVPFIVADGGNDQLHVLIGHPGTYHDQIYEMHPGMNSLGTIATGSIKPRGVQWSHGDDDSNRLEWYNFFTGPSFDDFGEPNVDMDDPSWNWSSEYDGAVQRHTEQAIKETFPHIDFDNTHKQEPWKFGSAKIPPIADFEHVGLDTRTYLPMWETVNKGWQPGKRGKGIIHNGELYTWNTDSNMQPDHSHVMALLDTTWADEFLYIDQDGSYRDSYGKSDELIQAADPRLKPYQQKEEDWKFGSSFWAEQRSEFDDRNFEDIDFGNPIRYTAEQIAELVKQPFRPGQRGKALQENGANIAIWNVDDHGGPHHDEVAQALGIWNEDLRYVLIDELGNEESIYDGLDDFHFGSVDENGNLLDWNEGEDGKGILTLNGSVYTWSGDEYDMHIDFIDDHPNIDFGGAHYLYIEPTGKVKTAWGTLGPEQEAMLQEADPRLYVDIDEGDAPGSMFSFGSTFDFSSQPEG